MTERKLILFMVISLIGPVLSGLTLHAQPVMSKPHGLYNNPIMLIISSGTPGSQVRYTTDGSVPTIRSARYSSPLFIKETTIVRAAEFRADTLASPITTCSYIYPASVLRQADNPAGYPSQWGRYVWSSDYAIADYGMDPELTSQPDFAQKVTDGIRSLPIVSLATDKGNLFNAEADEKTGGIYIHTSQKWERAVSAELFGGRQGHDVQVDCALMIHGGTGRYPEKNPKHSMRLKFKSDYGPGKLRYPLYGEKAGEVGKFNSLIIRNPFNDSWVGQHSERGRSQYIKDLYARLLQKQMGQPSANGIYVHLFINGMYWGLYCLSEHINDDFCNTHFGGDKEDWDVVKVSEDNGLEASDGSLDRWNELLSLAEKAGDNQYYFRLTGQSGAEPLLDVDNFIDYMLLNQYLGNEDWDYHNWTAIRNRKKGDRGFRFLVWDAECIVWNTQFNALDIYYRGCTTHIFKCLMQNHIFRHRYIDRAYKHLVAEDGLFTAQRAVALWDSLYNDIALALYAEAARWGDYRRDVHPWESKGELYTPENQYMAERNKLLTDYFPRRGALFLQQLIDRDWYPRTPPPVFLVNGAESRTDTLSFDDTLTLGGAFAASTILYTQNGSDPVSWTYSSSGSRTKSAITYQKSANLLATLPREEGRVTIKAIVQSFQGWSPTVEHSFYVRAATGIEERANDKWVNGKCYDLSGRKIDGQMVNVTREALGSSKKWSKGIYIINGKKFLNK